MPLRTLLLCALGHTHTRTGKGLPQTGSTSWNHRIVQNALVSRSIDFPSLEIKGQGLAQKTTQLHYASSIKLYRVSAGNILQTFTKRQTAT